MHRPSARGAELPAGRCPARRRARHRVRRGPSGIRVHGGERGLRAALRRAGTHVRRPVPGSHRADGGQDRGACRRDRERRPRGPGVGCEHRRNQRRETRSRPHRLPAAAHGERGRRRPRHAGGKRSHRDRVTACRGRSRGGGGILRLAHLHGALLPAGPPRRGAGLRRPIRQPRAPRRARLQRAAPPPEAGGGITVAGARPRAARRDLRRRGAPRARSPTRTPAPSSSSTTRPGSAATSSR